MTAMPRVVTRFVAGSVHAYDFSGSPAGDSPAVPAATFPVRAAVEVEDHAVAANLLRAVYTTADEMACIDREGDILWRLGFGAGAQELYNASAHCAFSPAGTMVWLYLPDAMAGRGDGLDHWLAIDAETGAIIARTELDCAGHGGHQSAHPDGMHMLLDVGEGQDGSRVYRGRLDRDVIELTAYPWTDRSLVGLAPDGHHFMTVHHDQEDVAFHAYPDGEVLARIPVESFGYDPDEAYVEWAGGYLDSQTAIVSIGGETEDEQQWHQHHLVDARTGQVHGTLDIQTRDAYDLEPLGDGSWLSTDDDGLWRHSR
ncbi:hypothetical protein HDA40_002667 [Hamadaea flava]|uniref:Uncharacterized protein n=1 Tax=Hamadaea flava TaxID=1742688 RepID=A0ABV8LLL4_9ACTN|nr:hypothetical protein [Hamadaea flava]MCP2324160.1 hypothetical protein [Hamadaea flava]